MKQWEISRSAKKIGNRMTDTADRDAELERAGSLLIHSFKMQGLDVPQDLRRRCHRLDPMQ